MIYDMSYELRDFTYITSVYKCIAAYNLKGHQIGRKIGDMLEILTMGGVYKCPQLVSHLDTEGKLEGFTTAGHKVEFGFYRDVDNKDGLFGAVECKCVGVEETTAGKGAAHLRKKRVNESFELDFNGRWMEHSLTQTVTVHSCTTTAATVKLSNSIDNGSALVEMPIGSNIKIVVDEHENLLNTTPNGNMLEQIPGIIRICKTIKLDSIINGVCQFSLYNCLTGPQTIEKAKQASLVAMDLRKKIDGHWGKEELAENEKQMNFIHVICEFSHWEQKSRNVISTCIDHNLIVADAVLIKAFDVFERTFGERNMLDMISKNKYLADSRVRAAVESVFAEFENHIFYDIAANSYVEFGYCDGKLITVQI